MPSAANWPRKPMPARPLMTPRFRSWYRRAAGRDRAGLGGLGGKLRQAFAMARTRTRQPPSTSSARRRARRRHGEAAAGQGTVLQQYQRHRRGLELVGEFGAETPAVAIIKHANPCGVAQGASLEDAPALALRCDRVAFGGIVASTARWMRRRRRRSRRSSPKSSSRRSATQRRSDLRDEEEPAPAATGGLPDPARPAGSSRPSPAACWCRTATRPRHGPT